jgi:hypothetical protein
MPIYNQALSKGQQQISDQGEGLTQMGQQLAQQGLGNYKQFDFGNFDEQRARIEDSVFGRLTKTLDQDYQNSRESAEQTLHNKGIPFSGDPNSRYQQELASIDRRYDEAKESARNQAVSVGGQELSRQYGVDLGQHQQGLSDISTLQSQGIGLQNPNFQQYQGYTPQYSNPTQTALAVGALKQGQQGLNIQQQLANQPKFAPPGPAAPPPETPSAFG